MVSMLLLVISLYVGMRAVDVFASVSSGGTRVPLNDSAKILLGLCAAVVILAAMLGVGTAIRGGGTAMMEPGPY